MKPCAPRIIVSNWKVSDSSTPDLIASLCSKLSKEELSLGAALRAAKLKTVKQRSHPYY